VTEGASIILTAPRPWFGNQQLGAFVISVDETKAGVLMPQGSLALDCSAGRHRLRARQWWYRSPTVEVDVVPGEMTRLSVGLMHGGSPIKAFLTLMFRPWRAVEMKADPNEALQPGPSAAETERDRRLTIWLGSIVAAGAILGLVGLNHGSTGLAAVGFGVAISANAYLLFVAWGWWRRWIKPSP
jgi:hypothetical protein